MKIFKIENGYTVIKDIKDGLEAMQREVGGCLTLAPHFDELTRRGIDIYADDEGLLKADPKPSLFVTSREDPCKVEAMLVGNLIFTGFDEEGNSKSLTQEQIDYISDHIFAVTYATKDGRSGRAFTFAFEGEEEWDYGCACYESALKAFNSLMEDEHSGFSLGITKSILNRLLDGKPLTPIKDEDDIWGSAYTYQSADDRLVYQCSRMPSLFKYVNQDGSVTYSDIDRYICVDLNDPDNRYQFGFIKQIIDEMFPITMPYMPDNQPWKIHCEDFLFDKNCGDFDTIGIFYVTKPDGKRLYVNRYFVEKDGDWKECDVAEYLWRRERRIK